MTTTRTETTTWDAADYLDSSEDEMAYLEAAFEDGTPAVIASAIGAIVRARGGATEIARQAGLSRETFYKAFAAGGNPTLNTMLSVLKALDIRLAPIAISDNARAA